MVPRSLDGYLTGATAAAGSLIGLLFVAVSLRPASVFGSTAPKRNRMLAESSFVALVNPFFVSLWGLLPGTNFGIPAVILGTLSLAYTLVLHLRLAFEVGRSVLAASLVSYSARSSSGQFCSPIPTRPPSRATSPA